MSSSTSQPRGRDHVLRTQTARLNNLRGPDSRLNIRVYPFVILDALPALGARDLGPHREASKRVSSICLPLASSSYKYMVSHCPGNKWCGYRVVLMQCIPEIDTRDRSPTTCGSQITTIIVGGASYLKFLR